ncbi:hypothetical protein CHUAL_007615 [Chamberlinius hualienensis]
MFLNAAARLLLFALLFTLRERGEWVSAGKQPLTTTTIRLIQIIHNSGQAIPEVTYPNDPNIEVIDQLGFGQLTNVGKNQELRLGQYIRKRYGSKSENFVDDYYRTEDLSVRSADYDSQLASSLALLSGLYPPKGYQTWDSKIKWQPIPVHTVPLHEDALLASTESLGNYSNIINTSKRKKLNKQNKELYKNLSILSGLEVTDAQHVTIIDRALKFAELYKLPISPWAVDSQLKLAIENVSNAEFNLRIDTTLQQLYTSGILFNEIAKNMDHKIKNNASDLRKINIYSTNDIVVAGFMSLIGSYNGTRPLPGSAVIIELHVDATTQQPYVNVTYRNASGEVTVIPISLCEKRCSPEQLMDSTQKAIGQTRIGKMINLNLMAFENNNRTKDQIVTLTVTIILEIALVLLCSFQCQAGGYGGSGGNGGNSGYGTASSGSYGGTAGSGAYSSGPQSSAADALKLFYNTQQGNNYNFGYNVEDSVYNNYQSRQESGDPKGQITGSYSVVEPDGSQRTVEYVADWVNGFRATVRDRNGVTQHGYNTDGNDGSYSNGNKAESYSNAYGGNANSGSPAVYRAGTGSSSSKTAYRRCIWVSVLLLNWTSITQSFKLAPSSQQLLPTQSTPQEKKSMPQNFKISSPCPSKNVTDETDSSTPCENKIVPVALDFIDPATVSNHSIEDHEGFLSCSTTIRAVPAKIHGCPDGFRCQIYESGDPVTGTPNKGMCITNVNPSHDDLSEDSSTEAQSLSEVSTVYLPGGCLLTSGEYADLESFLKGGHYSSCKCEQSLIVCKVPYDKNLTTRK